MQAPIVAFPCSPEVELTLLARRFQAGCRDAFGELYRRFYKLVVACARRIVEVHADAEDIAQWAFTKAFVSRDSLREPARVKSWLICIACNRARSYASRRARLLADDAALENQVQRAIAERALIADDERQQLQREVEQLSEKQRNVVQLRLREDLTFGQIGARLGCTEVAARVNYSHAVKHLRARLVA